MGYTHFWAVKHEIAPDVWQLIREDVQKLLTHPEVKDLVGKSHQERTKPPLIEDRIIAFNGRRSPWEDFCFTPDKRRFGFCSTDWMPYDLAVCMVLAAIADRTGPDCVEVASEGKADEWAKPLELAETILGRSLTNRPPTVEDLSTLPPIT